MTSHSLYTWSAIHDFKVHYELQILNIQFLFLFFYFLINLHRKTQIKWYKMFCFFLLLLLFVNIIEIFKIFSSQVKSCFVFCFCFSQQQRTMCCGWLKGIFGSWHTYETVALFLVRHKVNIKLLQFYHNLSGPRCVYWPDIAKWILVICFQDEILNQTRFSWWLKIQNWKIAFAQYKIIGEKKPQKTGCYLNFKKKN